MLYGISKTREIHIRAKLRNYAFAFLSFFLFNLSVINKPFSLYGFAFRKFVNCITTRFNKLKSLEYNKHFLRPFTKKTFEGKG